MALTRDGSPTVGAPAPAPPNCYSRWALDGVYTGIFFRTGPSVSRAAAVRVEVKNGRGTGTVKLPGCGAADSLSTSRPRATSVARES